VETSAGVFLSKENISSLRECDGLSVTFPTLRSVGREVCAAMSNVEFISDIREVDGTKINIFLAVGSLQYIQQSSDTLIDKIHPDHILIDQLPLYDGEQFVTLENGGLVYFPQNVFNQNDYVNVLEKLDCELIDSWECGNLLRHIPFHRDKVFRYSGLYFSDKTTCPRVVG
jgi:putative methyltransferase (TIGR04325 family)